MDRVEKAKDYFRQGYACSQAVAMPYADLFGMKESDVAKMMLPFGGGFGRQRLVCGAVSGMSAVIGMALAEEGGGAENKKHVYSVTVELCNKFKAENGSLICAELLEKARLSVQTGGSPEERTPEYYKKRPCVEIVGSAVRILEDYLKTAGKI